MALVGFRSSPTIGSGLWPPSEKLKDEAMLDFHLVKGKQHGETSNAELTGQVKIKKD